MEQLLIMLGATVLSYNIGFYLGYLIWGKHK